jgi:RHS repeat-associated protein
LVWYEGSGTSNRQWLHTDAQGSVVAWSDVNGNVTSSQLYQYGPYGEPQAWGGSRFQYTGQIAIPEAQLYYYKARVYDPITGRFLQTDPIGYKDDLDLYAYVEEDPLDKTDPTGLLGVLLSGTVWFATGELAGYGSAGVAISVSRDGHVEIGAVETGSTQGRGIGGGASAGASVFTGSVSGLKSTTHTGVAAAGAAGLEGSAKLKRDKDGNLKPTGGPASITGGIKKGGLGVGWGVGGALYKTTTATQVKSGNVKDAAAEAKTNAEQAAGRASRPPCTPVVCH